MTRGPAPKNPEDRARRNTDPIVDKSGWTEIDPAPNDREVPPIPVWVECSEMARVIYKEITSLPQAALWGPGTYFQIHLALPLIDKYLEKPGSDAFKTIVSTWGTGLRLTEDDLQRGRIRFRKIVSEEDAADAVRNSPNVVNMNDRRDRLLGKRDQGKSSAA